VCIWDVPAHNMVFCRYLTTSVRSTNKKMAITKPAECSVLLMTLHTVLGVLFFVIIKQNLDIITNTLNLMKHPIVGLPNTRHDVIPSYNPASFHVKKTSTRFFFIIEFPCIVSL